MMAQNKKVLQHSMSSSATFTRSLLVHVPSLIPLLLPQPSNPSGVTSIMDLCHLLKILLVSTGRPCFNILAGGTKLMHSTHSILLLVYLCINLEPDAYTMFDYLPFDYDGTNDPVKTTIDSNIIMAFLNIIM